VDLRLLQRHELGLIWTLDRAEVIHSAYRLVDGLLMASPVHADVPGWPPEQVERDGPLLSACFDRGGAFVGAFEAGRLVGVAVLDTVLLGEQRNLLQLKYLYVGHSYRGRGVGRALFERVRAVARDQGAAAFYVSSTPTVGTVDFYLGRGAAVAATPDPELYALEPEDIHLVCPV
jgi:GNAT superfamily N-acetyltransferase